jgi:hypothetical protein
MKNTDEMIKYNVITFNNKSIFSRENLLHIIQLHKINKKDPTTKYSLSKIVLYNITKEMDNIHDMQELKENNHDIFLREIEFTDDIEIEPSIAYFHPYNCLYFIYHEISSEKKKKNKTKKRIVMKKCKKTKKKIVIKTDIDS